jgi:IS5 family transposase
MCREFAGLDVSVHKREEVIEAHPQDNWHVAMMPSHRKALYKETPMGVIMEALEKPKAQT